MKTNNPGRPAKFTFTDKTGARHPVKGRLRVQSFIPEDVAKKLRAIAGFEGKQFSDVVSEALEKFVSNHKALKQGR